MIALAPSKTLLLFVKPCYRPVGAFGLWPRSGGAEANLGGSAPWKRKNHGQILKFLAIFPKSGGGGFPNPKTFVNLPSIFLYAKLGPKWPQMVKNMLYWSSGIILGPLRPLWDIGKLAMFGHFWPQKGHYDKGFPKGGGLTFAKNSQIMSFFFESVP